VIEFKKTNSDINKLTYPLLFGSLADRQPAISTRLTSDNGTHPQRFDTYIL